MTGADLMLIRVGVVIFLILWTWGGLWLLKNWRRLFGYSEDDPSETPGARSYGICHLIAVWLGGAALATYFAFY